MWTLNLLYSHYTWTWAHRLCIRVVLPGPNSLYIINEQIYYEMGICTLYILASGVLETAQELYRGVCWTHRIVDRSIECRHGNAIVSLFRKCIHPLISSTSSSLYRRRAPHTFQRPLRNCRVSVRSTQTAHSSNYLGHFLGQATLTYTLPCHAAHFSSCVRDLSFCANNSDGSARMYAHKSGERLQPSSLTVHITEVEQAWEDNSLSILHLFSRIILSQ